jgi:hypothetical protein
MSFFKNEIGLGQGLNPSLAGSKLSNLGSSFKRERTRKRECVTVKYLAKIFFLTLP